ncbi:MAG: 2-hydroxychromene-2-carboxylate isomerase [Alphaproteobacteria bacterium]|nr:2-hydroxychromene-2-carboxylate isomerase [Alphaproteobacteria bacterium]
MATAEVLVFFNMRSPYCYLASKRMFAIFEQFDARLVWRPLGGWDGRSPPERAKVKVPLSRQDVGRWCRKFGIPFTPPPITTDGTRAGAGSLLAEEMGLLRPYLVEVLRAEWAEGTDIGDMEVLLAIAERVGLDRERLRAAVDDPRNRERLALNRAEAERLGVIGVPTFVIGSEIFWGNDRIEFVCDHLRELRLSRL